jgi:hypothetical protein
MEFKLTHSLLTLLSASSVALLRIDESLFIDSLSDEWTFFEFMVTAAIECRNEEEADDEAGDELLLSSISQPPFE